MQDRRQTTRDKVLYGGVAETGEAGSAKDCVVRNISDKGASIEFNNVVRFPQEQMSLTIARKGRSFLAKIIWWRDNFVGVAFSDTPARPAGFRSRRTAAQERSQEAPAAAPHQGIARRGLELFLTRFLHANRFSTYARKRYATRERKPTPCCPSAAHLDPLVVRNFIRVRRLQFGIR